jgi:hypothetical protein
MRWGDLAAGKAQEEQSRTWQQDEISLQGSWRRKPSRTWETPRAEQRWVWKLTAQWTSRADVTKGKQTLEEAFGALEHRTGRKQLQTLKKGWSSREDDPFSREFGDRHRVEHHGAAGNGESKWEQATNTSVTPMSIRLWRVANFMRGFRGFGDEALETADNLEPS